MGCFAAGLAAFFAFALVAFVFLAAAFVAGFFREDVLVAFLLFPADELLVVGIVDFGEFVDEFTFFLFYRFLIFRICTECDLIRVILKQCHQRTQTHTKWSSHRHTEMLRDCTTKEEMDFVKR